jgi:hypothetical protein
MPDVPAHRLSRDIRFADNKAKPVRLLPAQGGHSITLRRMISPT